MLCTLSQGGCICVPSDEARVNDLSGAITSLRVNMAHMTPSVARVLPLDVLTSLEVLGLGGESLSPSDVSIWGQRTKVVNAYGPSECTVGCTINNSIPLGRTYTSIGKGVGGVTWIVDPGDHNTLTPIDGVGELLIEGPIVGIGYINEPEKTDAVFIEDPKWLIAGHKKSPGRHGRLYMTGDLVKYDPDASGCIVFVGRKDRQVKLRGQRVELAEIEHHLHKYLPSEATVAAEVIKPQGKEPTLVAFIAEQPEKKVNTSDDDITAFSTTLRKSLSRMEAALSEHLPIYMIPTAYIPLREMPALVSCKTDRKRLQEIGNAMSHQQLARFRATEVVTNEPKTEMEIKLQKLWIKLLGAEIEIGTNDNFFALGGDSLKAMRLVAAARGDGISLTVANIFANPKLSAMAKTAVVMSTNTVVDTPAFSMLGEKWDSEVARTEVSKLCTIESTVVEDIYPCTPLQEGLMALSAKISEAYIAQRVVDLADILTAHRLKDAFEAVARDSAILRTRIVQVPSHGLMQVVVKDTLSWSESSDLEEYLVQDRERSMGLGEPLARFAIITDEKSGKVQMVLTIHHALYDGWGMPMIIERVNQAYRGMKINKRTPFKCFIKYICSSDRLGSETYWREQLIGASGPQFPAHPYVGYQAQTDSLLERYVSFARASTSSTTVATAIRGAWAIVASNYVASNDIVFGETLTGRNAPVPGIEEIEGPLITTVPVRVRVNRKTRISDFLEVIHQQTLQRIPHEHMGLQHIRRLSPDAREACELKTGLVLHPNAEDEENTAVTEDTPANAFVPAGDEEAAREALKFSSYALMLVCSLGPEGFLIMASFDSNCVSLQLMEGVLAEFERTVQYLCEEPSGRIGDIHFLSAESKAECWKLSSSTSASLVQASRKAGFADTFEDVTATWIADPNDNERLLPVGAIGELLVERPNEFFEPELEGPQWLFEGCTVFPGRRVPLYKTGRLAKYNDDGTISFVSRDVVITKTVDLEPVGESQSTETTPRQQELIRLWSRLLAIPEDEIHLTDSFFELGGDSIGAMKLVSEAKMEGLELTVAQIFKHRRLSDMAEHMQSSKPVEETPVEISTPFSALDVPDVKTFLSEAVVPSLSDPTWEVLDVLPSRPLQDIAVSGTFKLPRYSARYELFYLDTEIDQARLFASCQELVDRNEILRTVFIHQLSKCYSVVLSHLTVSFSTYEIESPIEPFAKELCNLDIQTKIPLGSPFIKFLFVKNADLGQSCLILKVSHAQYDEICLPPLLRQLSAIYEDRPLVPTIPFSAFVYHILRETIPKSIPYWRSLLAGSSMAILPKPSKLTSHKPLFIHKYISIASRPKDITIATLAPAAWALVLARRLSLLDVTFGEVASGRNTTLANNDTVMGPCWQYIPMRVLFQRNWTVSSLLHYIQTAHVASTAHEGMGLSEIVSNCTDWPQDTNWFDSVVHQDVDHVEKLEFLGAESRMETVYPHLEPLREWKIQAFPDLKNGRMAIEVVTFEEWRETAESLLKEMEEVMELLVGDGNVPLFEVEGKVVEDVEKNVVEELSVMQEAILPTLLDNKVEGKMVEDAEKIIAEEFSAEQEAVLPALPENEAEVEDVEKNVAEELSVEQEVILPALPDNQAEGKAAEDIEGSVAEKFPAEQEAVLPALSDTKAEIENVEKSVVEELPMAQEAASPVPLEQKKDAKDLEQSIPEESTIWEENVSVLLANKQDVSVAEQGAIDNPPAEKCDLLTPKTGNEQGYQILEDQVMKVATELPSYDTLGKSEDNKITEESNLVDLSTAAVEAPSLAVENKEGARDLEERIVEDFGKQDVCAAGETVECTLLSLDSL